MGLRLGQRLIMNGERITLNFRNDVYFSDGAEVYADDYLFSLNLFNVAGSPNLPDTSSPYSGVGGGPEGLIAAQMLNSHSGPCAVHCPTINLFFGSQSVSNLADVIVPVLPSHIWRFFNPDHVCTVAQGCLDTTRPISCTATIRGPVTCSPSFVLTIPKPVYWSWFLPNVEIGSGPFWLHNWNGTAGTGEIDANPSYFNANWTAMADLNPQTLPYTLSASLLVPVFNPTKVAIQCGPASPGKIPPGATGMCQITNAATGPNELKVYDGRGTLWRNLKVVRNPLTGVYSATIPAGLTTAIGHPCGTPSATCFKMPPGQYRAVLQAKYTFHGQPRTWHQVFGFTIS
jgi:hypothetical protein